MFFHQMTPHLQNTIPSMDKTSKKMPRPHKQERGMNTNINLKQLLFFFRDFFEGK